jgi:phosphate transport system protein
MTTHSPQDIRRHYEADLEQLRTDTVRLGALVLENTKRLTDAFLENRLELAREVVAADNEIDALYSDLERSVFMIIALQQPVAGDLRLLTSMIRILYELERSGDLVVNCAEGMLHRDGYDLPPVIRGILARLFQASAEMFGKGIDAFADMDPTAALRLDLEDDVVDDLTRELYDRIGELQDIDLAIEISRTGRYMERIADHAVNIADHCCFIVTGSFGRARSGSTADE